MESTRYVHDCESPAPDPFGGRISAVQIVVAPDPRFPKLFRAQLKKVGGSYTRCLGDVGSRHVRVPLFEENSDLIDRIVAASRPPTISSVQGCFTFIFDEPRGARLGDARSWICVQAAKTFREACVGFVARYAEAVSRKIAPSVAAMNAKDEWAHHLSTEKAKSQARLRMVPGISEDPSGTYSYLCRNGFVLSMVVEANGIRFVGYANDARRFSIAEVSDILNKFDQVQI